MVAVDQMTTLSFMSFRARGLTALAAALAVTACAPPATEATTQDALITDPALAGYGLVLRRDEWGARPPTCRQVDHLPYARAPYEPYRITIHHSVTPTDDYVDVETRLRGIQSFHQNHHGWCDVGYHFLIGQDGLIYEGVPEKKVGTHTAYLNPNNLGIVFLGDYRSDVPSDIMRDAAVRLLRRISSVYGIPLDREHVKGHGERQHQSTGCPGRAFLPTLDDLVAEAAACQGDTCRDPCEGAPDGLRCDGERSVLCAGGSTQRQSYCAAGCGADGACIQDGCKSSRFGHVAHGSCVQVAYASCGQNSCGWWSCQDGRWTCASEVANGCTDPALWHPCDGSDPADPSCNRACTNPPPGSDCVGRTDGAFCSDDGRAITCAGGQVAKEELCADACVDGTCGCSSRCLGAPIAAGDCVYIQRYQSCQVDAAGGHIQQCAGHGRWQCVDQPGDACGTIHRKEGC